MTSLNSTKRLSRSLAQRRRDAEHALTRFAYGLGRARHPPSLEAGARRGSAGAWPSRGWLLSATLRLCAILLFPAIATADWPFARGDIESQGAADFSIGDDPQLLWTYEPEGDIAFEGAPLIEAGTVYLADADGGLHAVSLEDGAVLWTGKLQDTIVLAAPALDARRLYIGDADGFVRAVSRDDGEVLWKFEVAGEVYAGPIVYKPIDSDPLLLVTTEIGKLYALDPATGAEQWRFEIKDPLRCAPTVVNGHALLAGCDGRLHAVNLADGTESGSADIGGPTGCTAAVRDGVAYFGTESGDFYAVDANDPKQPKVLWTYRDPRRRQGVRAPAAVSASAVVYGNQAKGLYGLDPLDGELLWSTSLRSKTEAGPLILGDTLLVVTSRGRIRMFNLITGDETWNFDAGGGFLADPTASGGRVVLASTDGTVYCFGGEPQMDTDEH